MIHASYDAPRLDLYANGSTIARHLRYKQVSPPVQLSSGTYTIKGYLAGESTHPVFEQEMHFLQSDYTIVLFDKIRKIRLLSFSETPMMLGKAAKLRFFQLSPDAPDVDLALYRANAIFPSLSAGSGSPYVPLHAKPFHFEIRQSGTKRVLLDLPKVRLEPSKAYTIATVGCMNKSPKFEAVYFKTC